ncbi:MAG: hypothetical protein M1819_005004 [Sarea resinae]|nr:MAG: hypothetical protein M1819_005004 [Sarea resinae]
MASPVDVPNTSPKDEKNDHSRSSDEGTYVGDGPVAQDHLHLTIDTQQDSDNYLSPHSPSRTREESHRLNDDLEVLRAERVASNAQSNPEEVLSHTKSMHRSRSHVAEPIDEFDVNTNPIHEKTAVYRPPEHPSTNFAKLFKKIHNSSFLLRYMTYIVPVVLLLLIPLLVGALKYPRANVGGVKLLWFSVWLEIVWLTLWAGRIVAKCIPWPVGIISSLFTNNSKKWRDMGKQLEVPATLFFWWLGIEISFLPTMKHHHINGNTATRSWELALNKIIIALFVGAVLNLVEKIVIQLIAISFHLRTYADRIEINKFQIGSLVKLYTFSKEKITMEDSEFEEQAPSGRASGGTRTPMQVLGQAPKYTKEAFSKIGDVAGKVAGDFTGRQITQSTHPQQVILTLLHTTSGSQVLARRLFRTFMREGTDTVVSDDLKAAFDNDDEADAAFTMFDKDLNGDISMEELESVCVEIGRERKSITASLKDLDSVVSKLDNVLLFVIIVVTILVLISLISTSAAGVLTSAGSSVLALSWLFSATAQEFLQSIVFVFIKHPFDVGDRVSVYGNTGALMRGDDYFVKEISLLYTEFKKMEGHVVQAPNSYLNTLFILNQRRSGGLAEAVPIIIKFGTTLEQIEELRNRLLEFVRAEKREFQGNILTELREVTEVHSLTLNVVFFYKSNWQNEGLRMQRRNKFICAMMISMQELGIEGPRMRLPGQREDIPVYLQSNVPPPSYTPGRDESENGPGPRSGSLSRDQPIVAPAHGEGSNLQPHPSILRNGRSNASRPRGESVSAMSKRVDFSLGMKDVSSGDIMADIHEDRARPKLEDFYRGSPSRGRESQENQSEEHLARTTSWASSESRLRSSQSTHRNRFFGRHRGPSVDIDPGLMEEGMADIPEGEPSSSRLDPRSGLVSPQAMRLHSADSGASKHSARSQPWTMGTPKRSQTENLEMRKVKH